MIDTHCHLNFESYDEDLPAVLERATQAGVTRVLNPAIDVPSSQIVTSLVKTYPQVYAAVGIHPNSSADFAPAMLDEITTLAANPKIVAIGEIGLDYYRDYSSRERQIEAFEAQLALAARLKLPVIIHNRDASEDVIAILETWVNTLPAEIKDRPGVLHSFSAPKIIAERALAAGFYLGFTGPITYKNADDLRRIATRVPLDRLLVETDGPFLTPTPYRGKRNEPAYIPIIVQRLAALHVVPVEQMAQATTDNAIRLFQMA